MNKIDEWKKIILSINDNSFFDLMRNYLGRIETPFNKQDLINRLVFFFNRDQIKETILDILDVHDASLLTAIYLLNGPFDVQLQSLFTHWTYLDLHNRIQNLEERFLIYKKDESFYITPIFEELFLEKIISPTLLIDIREAEKTFDPHPWLNDSLMFALISFIQTNKNLIKIDGSIKKRGISELENIFPTLFSGEEGLLRFELCTSVLTNLNLIHNNDGLMFTDFNQWNRIASLSEFERYSLYYGAALAKNSNQVQLFAGFFTNTFNQFPRGLEIQKSSLNCFYKLYSESKTDNFPLFQLNKTTEILKLLHLLIENDEHLKINNSLTFDNTEVHSEPVLVIQPNFEITVKPFINLKDSMDLATAMDLKKYDLFSHFTLTRESFLRAYDKGIKSEEIMAKMEELSGKEVPQNIRVSLKDWEEDHKKVKLYSGVVLKVSEDKQMLIDNTDFLNPYIQEVLAPGVYLLDQSQERLWMEALGELSISPLPALKDSIEIQSSENQSDLLFSQPEQSSSLEQLWQVNQINEENTINSHILELLQKLESSGIKGDEKKEIEARIKRKLIIMESQINSGIIRPEITEAKGMNFQGKVRLIESALTNRSDRLELSHYTNAGIITILVQPVELLKEDKERTLIGKVLPDDEVMKIKVSKISKVKKIRSSLF